MAVKKGLGKGLEAFFVGKEDATPIPTKEADDANQVLEIDINKIEPNRDQPRKHFDETALSELADSIMEVGVIQPLIVKKELDYYSIIAGERRWRAARIAKLEKIPVIVKSYSELETVEIALIENIQRADLNPVEEALCYKRLIDEYGLTQETVAKKVGKNRSTVTNSLRLLGLDNRVLNFIIEGKLTTGHARTLLGLEDKNEQFETAEKIMEDGLSVRDVESLIKEINEKQELSAEEIIQPGSTVVQNNKILYKNIEADLNQLLGTKVNIKDGKNKGKIEIEYYSEMELDRLLVLFKQIEAGGEYMIDTTQFKKEQ